MVVFTFKRPEDATDDALGIEPHSAVGRLVSFEMPANYADITVPARDAGWTLHSTEAVEQAIPNDLATALKGAADDTNGWQARVKTAAVKVEPTKPTKLTAKLKIA
jgi:hypothetical protein